MYSPSSMADKEGDLRLTSTPPRARTLALKSPFFLYDLQKDAGLWSPSGCSLSERPKCGRGCKWDLGWRRRSAKVYRMKQCTRRFGATRAWRKHALLSSEQIDSRRDAPKSVILEAQCAQHATGRSTVCPPEALLHRTPMWQPSHLSGLTSCQPPCVQLINTPMLLSMQRISHMTKNYWGNWFQKFTYFLLICPWSKLVSEYVTSVSWPWPDRITYLALEEKLFPQQAHKKQ